LALIEATAAFYSAQLEIDFSLTRRFTRCGSTSDSGFDPVYLAGTPRDYGTVNQDHRKSPNCVSVK